MKVTGTVKFMHKFERWNPVVTQLADGSQIANYVYDREENGILLPMSQGIISLITQNQLDIDTEVRNLRDRTGKPVFLLGYDSNGEDIQYIMYVSSAIPQMDPFGNVVAWRHQLKRAAA